MSANIFNNLTSLFTNLDELFGGTDVLSGGGVVGGIVAIITTFGWWLRRERVESAKANNAVAENNASSSTYNSQAKEIEAVRTRLSAMEAAYVAQSIKMNDLILQLSRLEAKIVGANSHYDNLVLCDVCIESNKRILAAMDVSLDINHHNH